MEKLSLEDDSNNVERTLQKLLESSIENPSSSIDIKDIFIEILNRHQNTPSVSLLVIKCIAEVTKNAEQRTKFSSVDILEKLMEMMEVALAYRDIEILCQLCRAFGNIFYSNDDSRNIIFHHDGGQALIKLFDISNHEIKSTDELHAFSKVRSGVTSNYLLGNEELSQKAIKMGIIEKMEARINDALNPFDDVLLEHLLPILSILTEQVSDLIFNSAIITCIVKIFKTSSSSDVVESCLELFQCQAESDDIKLLLAKQGVCEHIFESLEKYKSYIGNVEARSLIKLSCDLVVLILTGGKHLY